MGSYIVGAVIVAVVAYFGYKYYQKKHPATPAAK